MAALITSARRFATTWSWVQCCLARRALGDSEANPNVIRGLALRHGCCRLSRKGVRVWSPRGLYIFQDRADAVRAWPVPTLMRNPRSPQEASSYWSRLRPLFICGSVFDTPELACLYLSTVWLIVVRGQDAYGSCDAPRMLGLGHAGAPRSALASDRQSATASVYAGPL